MRELGTIHIDRNGKVFDDKEVSSLEEAPWKSFEPETGAAATLQRLCELAPKLVERLESNDAKE